MLRAKHSYLITKAWDFSEIILLSQNSEINAQCFRISEISLREAKLNLLFLA